MHQAEILLVDDDSACRELALRALKKAGYGKVAIARDGVEAIAMLLGEGGNQQVSAESVRFVLLDMKLPKLDGVRVLQRLRSDERTRKINVFSLSASEDPAEIEECLNLGVLAVLPKPLDPQALQEWFPAEPALAV